MLKILKEYSYLLCLTGSLFLFAFLYMMGWLPEDILQEMEGNISSAKHMVFLEESDDFSIAEEWKILSQNFLSGQKIKEEKRTIREIIGEVFLLNVFEQGKEEELAKNEFSDRMEAVEQVQEETEKKPDEAVVVKAEAESNTPVKPVTETENDISVTSKSEEKKDRTEKVEAVEKIEAEQGINVSERTEVAEKKWIFQRGDVSYFDDALFIGDSRTEGLREYGGLGNATVLSDSGMSIYRVWKEKFSVGGKKQSLEEILSNHRYGKVYLMLGINELGYDYDQTKKRYEESLAKIIATQPEAIIYLQANLHVTDEKSKNSDIYNNENINRINLIMKELAEKNQCVYLDVNPLFDDENGNLSKEYTVDQAHILGIYYIDWANWILEHCAVLKETKG